MYRSMYGPNLMWRGRACSCCCISSTDGFMKSLIRRNSPNIRYLPNAPGLLMARARGHARPCRSVLIHAFHHCDRILLDAYAQRGLPASSSRARPVCADNRPPACFGQTSDSRTARLSSISSVPEARQTERTGPLRAGWRIVPNEGMLGSHIRQVGDTTATQSDWQGERQNKHRPPRDTPRCSSRGGK